MRWGYIVLACAVVCSFANLGFAQEYPKADVHVGYSYLNIDTNGLSSRQNANGWEAGASGNFNKWFGVEFSVSGYYKTYSIADVNPLSCCATDVKVRDYSYLAGPRLNYKFVFVHALLGGDHLSGSVAGLSASQDSFAGAFGGGIQQRIAGPLAVRISADYVFTRHNILGGSSYTQNNYRATAGIAYTFGGVRTKSAAVSRNVTLASAAPMSMPVPALGISVITTEDNKGAQIVDITQGGVADFGGLHRMDVIKTVNGKEVHTPMELAAVLSSVSGNVTIGYIFKTSAMGWMGNVTTVVVGK